MGTRFQQMTSGRQWQMRLARSWWNRVQAGDRKMGVRAGSHRGRSLPL
ncbi:hypothetical protein [Neorhizobium galegae]|nr:hypothetical protein [Neorhizobium galegae]MCQ1808328.1 hypothetical protein [Neorhizobium galegae]